MNILHVSVLEKTLSETLSETKPLFALLFDEISFKQLYHLSYSYRFVIKLLVDNTTNFIALKMKTKCSSIAL